MSSSSSSEDDSSSDNFMPVGFDLLSISSKHRPVPVLAKRVENTDFSLPPAMQYMTLLDRAMKKLNKDTGPVDTERMKLPLKVFRKMRKTFVNVVELAGKLDRQPEHLCHFISERLYTEGSINKDGLLVLGGTYLQSDIEKALRHFIELYVACKSCDSVEDTSIVKENKLFFLKCTRCKSSRCVGNTVEGLTLKEKTTPKLRGLI